MQWYWLSTEYVNVKETEQQLQADRSCNQAALNWMNQTLFIARVYLAKIQKHHDNCG